VQKRKTILDLQRMKAEGEKITVLTAYDYPFARLMDQAGIDIFWSVIRWALWWPVTITPCR